MVISNTQVAGRFLMNLLRQKEVEEVWALALDSRCLLKAYSRIFCGTINHCDVYPREIFRFALLENANYLVIAHNHPSGDSTPSPSDFKTSRRLSRLGMELGVPVLDHIIVSDRGFQRIPLKSKSNY